MGGAEDVRAWLTAHSKPLENPWTGEAWRDSTPLDPRLAVSSDPLQGRERDYTECQARHGGDRTYIWPNRDYYKALSIDSESSVNWILRVSDTQNFCLHPSNLKYESQG